MLDDRPYTLDRVVRLGISAGLIWGLVWLLGYLSEALLPFAGALLLAYLINPLVVVVQRRVPNRVAAVFLSLLLVAVVLGIVAAVLVPLVMHEIAHVGEVLKGFVNDSALAKRAADRLPADLWAWLKAYAARPEVREFFSASSALNLGTAMGRRVLPGMRAFASAAGTCLVGLVGLAMVALYMVLLLLDYHRVRCGWAELIPAAYRDTVVSFVRDVDGAMHRYFRAQALVAAIVGVLFALGFWMVGLPMGILLGLFIGLLNMVPYLQMVGAIPAGVLAMVHAIETGTGFWQVIALTALVFVVVQAIQDAVLTPMIMGRVSGLSPAMILLSLSIWGKLLGFLGLLIAIPVTCLLLAYYKRVLAGQSPIVANGQAPGG